MHLHDATHDRFHLLQASVRHSANRLEAIQTRLNSHNDPSQWNYHQSDDNKSNLTTSSFNLLSSNSDGSYILAVSAVQTIQTIEKNRNSTRAVRKSANFNYFRFESAILEVDRKSLLLKPVIQFTPTLRTKSKSLHKRRPTKQEGRHFQNTRLILGLNGAPRYSINCYMPWIWGI
jgi:hypothetical protein